MMTNLERLLEFLMRLQNSKIHFKLDCVRDAIMVVVPTPSKYYEIEFFGDGHIESQTFGPSGAVTTVTIEGICESVILDVNG